MADNGLPQGFSLDESDDPQAEAAARGWKAVLSDRPDPNDTMGAQPVGSPIDFAVGPAAQLAGEAASAIPGIAESIAGAAPEILGNEVGAIRLTPTGRALGTVSEEAMQSGPAAVQKELQQQARAAPIPAEDVKPTQNDVVGRVKARFGDSVPDAHWDKLEKAAIDSNKPYVPIMVGKKGLSNAKTANHAGFFPNFNTTPTGEIGSVEDFSGQDLRKAWQKDALGWHDSKYGSAKDLIQKHADSNVPVHITTGSDLVARDDYANKLPNGSSVDFVLTQPINGEFQSGSPFPSNGRLAVAANKLQKHGISTRFLMRNPESGDIKPIDEFSNKLLLNKHPWETKEEPEGYAGGGVVGDSGSLPQGFKLDAPVSNSSDAESETVPPSGFQLDDEKYGSLPQQALTGLEGVAQGISGPLAPAAEISTGLTTPQAIRGRAEANPITHGLTEAGGFAGSALIPGLGEASLAAQVGNVGEHAAALLPEATTLVSKIAQSGIKTGAELAALQTSDEISKAITQDPNQSLQTAAINVGLSGILGGAGGAVIGSVSPLWNKTLNKLGVEKLASDFMGESKFLTENPDLVQGASSEINDRISSADRLIKGGLKSNLINALTNDLNPEKVAAHVESISKAIENAPEALKKESIFQDAVDSWKSKVFKTPDAAPVEPVSKVSPDYGEIPPTVLKARRPTPARIAQIGELGAEADLSNLEAANRSGFNPYETAPPEPVIANPAEVFQATENLKRQLQEWGQYNKALVPIAERPFRDASRGFASSLKDSLEDSKVWGAAADAQRTYNKAISPLFDIQKEFLGKFASKEFGEKVADPTKINTYLNQADKSKAGLKSNYVRNYLDQTQEAADAINKSYLENGLEQPFEEKLNPTPVLDHSLNTPPSSGVSLARWAHRGAAASMGANVAGHLAAEITGGGLGFLVGHPLAGAWMGDKILKPVFAALAKPIADRAINVGAAKGAVDYVGNVIKGQKIFSESVGNFFKSGAEILPKHLIPDMASRDNLEKSLEHASTGENALNIGGGLGHYLPGHATAAAATGASAINYLKSLKPQRIQQSPLDKPSPVDPVKQQQYVRALGIAQQPLLALQYAKKGLLQPQDVQTLNAIYPQLRQKMAASLYSEMIKAKSEGNDIPYKQRMSLSLLLGQPLDSTMTQPAMQNIMMVNAPKATPVQMAGKQKKPSQATANSMQKVNKMYATPDQSRAASRVAGKS